MVSQVWSERRSLRYRLSLRSLSQRAVTCLARQRAGPLSSPTVCIGAYQVGADNGDLLLGHPDIRY